MLRSVLRNVQYYLLFFSILLVLLAFQRLPGLYDSGFIAHPFMDRPMGHTPTSPDTGRIYYGGDESKEIGLFKFKLGLFKFILPTFDEEDKWERTNELSSFMSVPPPPNKRRKSVDNMYLKLRAQSKLHAHKKKEGVVPDNQETPKSYVAYVVVAPQLQHQSSKLQTSFNTEDGEEAESDKAQSFLQRASVLSQSIKRAHSNSPYEYQLYALNYLNGASTDTDTAVDDDDTKQAHEALVQSGFNVINVNEVELNDIGGKGVSIKSDRKLRGEDEQQGLLELLNRHDVIVQISLNSFLLKPMDDIFDVLLKGKSMDNIMGIVNATRVDKVEGKSDDQSRQAGTKSTQVVDSFALESLDVSSSAAPPIDRELFIFRSTSRLATSSYLKSLKCTFQLSMGEQPAMRHPKLIPSEWMMVARKNRQIDANPKQDPSNDASCRIQVIESNSLLLDRCLYDAGNFDAGHNCSNVKDDALVAHFPEGSSSTADADSGSGTLESEEPDGTPQKKDEAQEEGHIGNSCSKPWDYLIKEDCSKSHTGQEQHGQEQEEICTWLCSKWFDFAER